MPQFIKRFLEWIALKEKIETTSSTNKSFKEGEVWMAYCGENVGYEVSGKNRFFHRPVVILKKLNSQLFYGLPTTTKVKSHLPFQRPYVFQGKEVAGLIFQIRSLSVKRLHYKMGELPESDLEYLRSEILTLLKK